MPTFKITVSYDGTDFVGWQRQASGVSIQGLLEDALRELDQRAVTVHGAGRTDAGVHALGQVASFALNRSIDGPSVMKALNALLPATVRVLAADAVPDTFHARYGATAKTYRYRVWNADVSSPFERAYAWHVMGPLDREAMAAAARLVEGSHDFAAFRAASGTTKTSERVIYSSRIVATPATTGDAAGSAAGDLRGPGVVSGGELITYEIRGNGFLRYMVRTIVGSLVQIGRGRVPVAWMADVLAGRDRALAGPTAPPQGLVLVSVEYELQSA